MTKTQFIALADHLIAFDQKHPHVVGPALVEMLADFCATQNPRFNRATFIGYIQGVCGPNGGPVKIVATKP